jgi:hypothetical protein
MCSIGSHLVNSLLIASPGAINTISQITIELYGHRSSRKLTALTAGQQGDGLSW